MLSIRTGYEEARRLDAGYAVFPCRDNKAPACRHDFTDTSTDPATICNLRQNADTESAL
jgi:hypothetical protein